jgi:hypothetical protein
MNLGDMKSEVIRRVNDQLNATNVFTDTEITVAINNGLAEIGDITEYLEVNEVYTATGALYDDCYNPGVLSKLLLTMKHIFLPINNLWMEAENYLKLDQAFSRWEVLFSTPYKFIWRGLSYLAFYPRAVAGTQFDVFYTAMPDPLVNLTDTPSFPEVFHLGLVCYATFELLAKKQEVKKAMLQWTQYLDYQKGLMDFVKQRQSLDRIPSFGPIMQARSAFEYKPF